MPSSPFAPEAVGMCPATLLAEPRSYEPPDLERIAWASASAGFLSLSLWSSYAMRNGVDATRSVLDDVGITVRVVEAATKWTDGPGPAVDDAEEQLDIASALGADILLAATGRPTVELDRAAAGFAALCDRAEERGVRVAIEFIPCWAIPDLATAWRVVRESGARNGGIVIDMMHWHYQPGGPNLDLLQRIPGEHVHYVQVCDVLPGPPPTADDYIAEALSSRPLPGEGVVDTKALIGALAASGADPYFAFEVFNTELARSGAEAMAARLRTATETLFG